MRLWILDPQSTSGEPCALPPASAYRFSREGGLKADVPGHEPAAQLLAAVTRGGTIAAIIVPGSLAGQIRRDGQPLPAGLHALRHGQQLVLGDRKAWVAAEATAAVVSYDPNEHGEDQYCRRTKCRLKPGQSIYVCPGQPGERCGAVYTAEAWAIRVRCHACGFDPSADDWRPPVPADKGDLDELLRLAG
jgi:hypothetical protein